MLAQPLRPFASPRRIFHRLLLCAAAVIATASAPAQTINPADYGNITLHLKADALNQPGDTEVTEWGPLFAAETSAPTYVASDARFNGMPVVRFDGVNNVMKKSGANYQAQTIFAVAASSEL